MHPFLKWTGGKSRLLSQYIPLLPESFHTFLQHFTGAGALFFHVRKLHPLDKIIIQDKNEELINCYEVVRQQVDGLISLLEYMKNNHSKEHYYKVRHLDVKTLSAKQRAARFIYLNKTCYNGLYRVNSRGRFNVPIGSYKNPAIFNENDIREASLLLQNVCIRTAEFEELLADAEKGDFIYLDPPYFPVSPKSAYPHYSGRSFREKDQIRLFEIFKELDRRKCLLMQSNSNTEFIRNLYGNFRFVEITAIRSISPKAKGRGKTKELLILNY